MLVWFLIRMLNVIRSANLCDGFICSLLSNPSGKSGPRSEPTQDTLGSSSSSVPTWTRFSQSTSDFLLVDTNSSGVRRHLRADKVRFWTHLIPAVSDIFRSLTSSSPSLSAVGPAPEAITLPFVAAYVFIAIIVAQVALLGTAVFLLTRMRHRLHLLTRNSRATPLVSKL